MALVTLQRSPTPSAASTASTATTTAGEDFGSDDERRLNQSLSESFFMVKGAALFLQQGTSPQGQQAQPHHQHAGDLPQHLQVMINILRSEDRIKLAVRLESGWSERVRYMVVVYTNGRQDTEENILLGMDFTNKDSKNCSIGMALPLWSDTKIHLDGDGGFTVNTVERTHVFKPVSVQAMWSALQILHKACEVSRRHNYFPGGMALTWLGYYESCVSSEQSCINQWNAMKDLETTRPDSPDMFVDKPSERECTEGLLKAKLRSIMSYQDLDNVTSKQIRTELEQHMSCNLNEYKEFIDNEMLLILGQMDKASLIFDHLYLGSEWNASNLEELQDAGVGYILNVTREIDNFFPGTFCYHNIRVYDEEATDLLAHWNHTYHFILKAKKNNSKCLVHCKMGVSRSASTVIAYAMKEYGWSLEKAYGFVKQKRSITRPNAAFMRQLAEYEGILDASKQRHNRLWHPDIDCEMSTDGHQGSSQCCQRAPGEPGGASPSRLTPGRAGGLDVDPAYNNYYFRRLSDSALDSEPSTPVRGPAPLLNMDKVFIQIEDVERDALLDDEAPLPHLGAAAEGTAGLGALEELRLRLEFSTVEEEDEEEVRKEEAEMEVLMHPDGGGAGGGGGEGTGMDLASLNESSNNNNNNNNNNNKRLAETSPSNTHQLHPPSRPGTGRDAPSPDTKPSLNPILSSIQALSSTNSKTSPCQLQPSTTELFLQPACNLPPSSSSSSSSCSSSPSQAPPYGGPDDSSQDEMEVGTVLEGWLPELRSMEPGMEESHAVALVLPQHQTHQGLVRRRAQRLERLWGSECLLLQHTCRDPKRSSLPAEEKEEPSHFPGDLPSSSPPCSAGLNLPPASGASSPRGPLPLTRSSSSDSVRSVRGEAGLVRQRALEIEARTRLAGLTMPSPLKRSNSLAKLDGLQLSHQDLCAACSSDTGSLALFVSLSPDPGPGWDCLAAATTPRSGPRKARGWTLEGVLAGGDQEPGKGFLSSCLRSSEEVGTWESSG